MDSLPVARSVVGGLIRRKMQTLVIGLVLLVSTGACVLAVGLVVDSSAPFDHAFAAQHGADVVAAIDRAVATPVQVAAASRLPEVTACRCCTGSPARAVRPRCAPMLACSAPRFPRAR